MFTTLTEGSSTEMTFQETLSELATRQKTAKGVSLYSRWVNRPAGRVLAATAYFLGLRPNHVTLASAVCTSVAIALLAIVSPEPIMGLFVTLFLILGFALDSADGQLARLTGTGSAAGEWLDHVVDAGKMVALHSAVLISLYRFSAVDPAVLLLPLLFQLLEVVMFIGGTLTELLKRSRPPRSSSSGASRLRSILLIPADFGVLCLVFLLIGNQRGFLTAYALLALIRLIFTSAFMIKWYRELQSL